MLAIYTFSIQKFFNQCIYAANAKLLSQTVKLSKLNNFFCTKINLSRIVLHPICR